MSNESTGICGLSIGVLSVVIRIVAAVPLQASKSVLIARHGQYRPLFVLPKTLVVRVLSPVTQL